MPNKSKHRTHKSPLSQRDRMRNQFWGHGQKKWGLYAECASTHTHTHRDIHTNTYTHTCTHTTLQSKGKGKAFTAIFNPSLFLINPKLAQTTGSDSMTDEFAVVNVKRNGLPPLISPFLIVCETLGCVEKYNHSDEPYLPITQGTLTYCQVLEGGGRGPLWGWWLSGCSGTPDLNLEPMMNTNSPHAFTWLLRRHFKTWSC